MSQSVVTNKAKQKMVKARAGILPLSKITGMVFGDGAKDSSGNILIPSSDENALKHELMRKEIDRFVEVNETSYRYTCTLLKAELAGENLNEIALYDSDNDLVAIKSFMSKGKDGDMEMTFEIDDQF